MNCLALDNGQDHLDCVRLAEEDERFVLSRGMAAVKIRKHLPAGWHNTILISDWLTQLYTNL